MAVVESPDEEELPPFLLAGIASVKLLAEPKSWINRRVETIELLSNEETRRRVSIDFTLSETQQTQLAVPDGVAVPISVLTKEPRRNFDLRDEGGRSIPALGKEQNGELTHVAMMSAAVEALPDDLTPEVFEIIAADLRQIVINPPDRSRDALAFFIGSAEAGDRWRAAIWEDPVCRSLLMTFWANYALYAVLVPGGPVRRILKYGYSEGFDLGRSLSFFDMIDPVLAAGRLWSPDRRDFVIECPGASRAVSFHVEVAVPEEVRLTSAFLYDFDLEEVVSGVEKNVDRASLYAHVPVQPDDPVDAFIEIAPEQRGGTAQAAVTALLVTGLLWAGVISKLDASNPGAAVSMLLAGAALFSGVAAVRGEHALVKAVFSSTRRWLFTVTFTALVASASLAMEIPRAHPVKVWLVAAAICSVAAARLSWSAVRAPS